MRKIEASGKEVWIIGGAVRSFLLDRDIHDYDLTTNARPSLLKEIFAEYPQIDTGLKHGTLVVLIDHHPVEITTFRKDGAYADHRHPSAVTFSDTLKEDCARRDFTVNALAYHPARGLRDYFGGRQDLALRLIRCINDPDERFNEDALRILRAIRFASQLDFDIASETAAALMRNRELLNYISAQRIRGELELLLVSEKAPDFIDEYRQVLEVFIPELELYAPALFEEVISSLSRSVKAPDIRMAVLLTHVKDPGRVVSRLKYSGASQKLIQALIASRTADISSPIAMRKVLRVFGGRFDDLLHYRSALDPGLSVEVTQKLYETITHDAYCFKLKDLSLSGSDLTALGLQGPRVGGMLTFLLDEVTEERLPNEKTALLCAARKKMTAV